MPNEIRLYADRCGDDSCAPFFEREALLEGAFLAVRAARAAQAFADREHPGAFAVFPVAVYGPYRANSGCGAAGQWPIDVSVEPGSFFGLGKTRIDWSADLPQGRVTGYFTVTVADDPPATAGETGCVLTTPDGAEFDVATPFPPIVLRPIDASRVRHGARQLVDLGQQARTAILTLSGGLIRRVVWRLRGGFTNQVDADDAHQLAALELLRLIERYASPDRPRVSWGRYVALYTNRAVVRALEQERRFGRPEQAMRRLMEERPDLAGASLAELRAELEQMTAEAAHWSDQRIALAVSGPIKNISLDEVGYESRAAGFSPDSAGELPVDMLVGAIGSDDRLLHVARPYLVSQALVPDDGNSVRSDRTVRRSRQALVAGVSAALGIKASSARELAQAFAEAGESYERPEDRRRMEARARRAIVAVMERGS